MGLQLRHIGLQPHRLERLAQDGQQVAEDDGRRVGAELGDEGAEGGGARLAQLARRVLVAQPRREVVGDLRQVRRLRGCHGACWCVLVRTARPRLARVRRTYLSAPPGKLPGASGTYGAQEAGTRTPYSMAAALYGGVTRCGASSSTSSIDIHS